MGRRKICHLPEILIVTPETLQENRFGNYRTLLQRELIARIERNKQYSLRAYARDLDLSPGFLSGLLAGRKGLSPSRASSLLENLDWDDGAKRVFTLLVRLETTEVSEEENRIIQELSEIREANLISKSSTDLEFEFFHIISEWHHAAVLELLFINGSVHEPQWLADRLGLDIDLIQTALDRLCRVGLLARESNKWIRGKEHVVMPSTPSECVRSFHRSFLENAIAAVDGQDPETRILQTSLIPISRKLLPRIEEHIDRLVTDSIATAGTASKDDLYCLSVAFHKVTKDC